MKSYACGITVDGVKCIYDCDTKTELHKHLRGGHHFTERLPPLPEPARPEPRQDGTTDTTPFRIHGTITLRVGFGSRMTHDANGTDEVKFAVPHGAGLIPLLRAGARLYIEIQAERP